MFVLVQFIWHIYISYYKLSRILAHKSQEAQWGILELLIAWFKQPGVSTHWKDLWHSYYDMIRTDSYIYIFIHVYINT